MKSGFLLLETLIALTAFGFIAQSVMSMYANHVFISQEQQHELATIVELKKMLLHKLVQPEGQELNYPFRKIDAEHLKISFGDIEGGSTLRQFKNTLKFIRILASPSDKRFKSETLSGLVILSPKKQ